MTERFADYDEWLNDVYEPITFGYLTFYPADIIAELDPIAYRVGYSDYQDSMEEYND